MEATLLLIGAEPENFASNSRKPKGYEPVSNAISRALIAGSIKGEANYYIDFGEQSLDTHKSTVEVNSLKEWLLGKGINTGFFFPGNATSLPGYLDPLQALLTLGVDQQVAEDWLAVRKAKLTQTALDGVVREAGRAGIAVSEAVRICAERGWRGFKADWDWRSGGAPQGRVFDHATGAMVGTGNSALDLAQQQAARAADWLASLPTDAEGNLI